MKSVNDEAWNNFVMHSYPTDYDVGNDKRSAAIAHQYWSLANNGGINSFLTACHDLGSTETLEALRLIGALKATEQFSHVLDKLGVSIPASSEKTRWDILEQRWTDDLNDLDVLSSESDKDLLQALENHVSIYEDFYLKLNS